MWITPQAQPGTHALDNNMGLYLSPAGNDAQPGRCCGPLSYLLNLALPAAQDLFFSQFETMIVRYNASRIWFDYNTAARQTHWNEHETASRQGLLELGFYQGLYNVFDRTLRKYPHVWIEGCASGGPSSQKPFFFFAPRSVRRPLLTLQANPGPLYRCGKSDFKEQPSSHGRRKRGPEIGL